MSIDTENPTATATSEAEHGDPGAPITTPSANGTGYAASAETTAPVVEIAVGGGHKARVGDPVAYRGRPGTVEKLIWKEATARKRSRWVVIVRHTDGLQPQIVEAAPDDVWVRQDEVTNGRPTSWADDLAGAAEAAAGDAEGIPSGAGDDLYPVPTALSFGGKETKEAADLRQLGGDWIETTEDFPDLKGRDLDYEWAAKGGSTSQEAKISWVRTLNVHERRKSSARFMIVLAADHLRDLRADRTLVAAFVHDALCLIRKSKKGKLYIGRPDFQGNTKNVARCGAVLPKAKAAAFALERARGFEDGRNARLFEVDETEAADVGI